MWFLLHRWMEITNTAFLKCGNEKRFERAASFQWDFGPFSDAPSLSGGEQERSWPCFSSSSRFTFVWVSLSGFSSSFLPKEESVTAAPEVEVNEDYQASSQVSFSFQSLEKTLCWNDLIMLKWYYLKWANWFNKSGFPRVLPESLSE